MRIEWADAETDQQSMAQAKEKGRRWVISTKEEMRQAVMEVATIATRKVSIFTHDLETGIYDDPDFLEIIKRLVLSQAYSRIRVLIADPHRAIKNGNAFVHLGRRLNTYIEFRHVREDLRTHAESFCIADETALVYRLQANAGKALPILMNPLLRNSTERCSMRYGQQVRLSSNFVSSVCES